MFTSISRFLLYLVPLSVLAVATTTFFPFIGIKYYVFRLLVTGAVLAFLCGWAFEGEPVSLRKRLLPFLKSPLGIGVTAFVVAFLLACFFGVDPHGSFWSNFERGEGGFQMIHYYLFLVMLILTMTERKHWYMFFGISAVAGLLAIGYGVLAALDPRQFIGTYQELSDQGLWYALTHTRFQGSLGNAAYVAPYLMFIGGFLTILWLHIEKNWIRTTLFGLTIFLYGLFFILSQTRAAFLGLVVALGVGLIYILLRSRVKKYAIGALALFVVLLGVLFAFRNTDAIRSIPAARVLAISTQERTVQTRLWNWGAAWKGFKERPVFGWGPEAYPIVFDRHFDPRHFLPNASSETWFDRAHSVVFDYLAETGLVGFLAYVAMLVTLMYTLLRYVFASAATTVTDTVFHAVLIALPVGYGVQALALFDVLPVFMNLMVFAGFVYYLAHSSRKSHEHATNR